MPDMWIWFFLAFVGGFFALDAWCWFSKKRPTFSQKMRDWAIAVPYLPFFIGLLLGTGAGHLWWCNC